MSLIYQYNLVFKKYAAIFVTEGVKDLEWKDAMAKGESARKLFLETFEFEKKEISMLFNPTKPEIIAKFDEMQAMVD